MFQQYFPQSFTYCISKLSLMATLGRNPGFFVTRKQHTIRKPDGPFYKTSVFFKKGTVVMRNKIFERNFQNIIYISC